MKVLYIAPPMADYQSDALFHGLRLILGADVVDEPKLEHMYVGGPKPAYGLGFTLFNLLPDIAVDRSNIRARIIGGEFDAVIVAGDHLYGPYPLPHEDVLWRYMPPSRVLLIDGSDSTDIADRKRLEHAVYFKRENIGVGLPISFAIPEEKMVCGEWPRRFKIAPYVPGEPYAYERESDYYDDYRASAFARTRRKAGWDCLRHYEIMACGTIPIFEGIEQCDPATCMTLPRKALLRVMDTRGWGTMAEEEIAAVGRQIFDWCKAHCTTEALAAYVLSHTPVSMSP